MANTKNTLVADRYSDALVELAKEGKLTFEKINTDLQLINSTLIQSKDLNEVLINPTISLENKKEIIEKVFSQDVDVLIINLLKVIVDKGRFSIVPDVISSYGKALDNVNNISRVNVISAVEMTEEAKNRLQIKLEEKLKKSVVLDIEIDSNIIAGLIIRMGDNIVDMSLKHKLEDLSKNILR